MRCGVGGLRVSGASVMVVISKAAKHSTPDRRASTYLFGSQESRESVPDLACQSPGRLRAIHRLQLHRQRLQVFDAACYVDPLRIPGIPATLPVYPEIRVFQSLNKEIAPLVAVGTPRLYGQRLVLIVLVADLLIAVFDEGGDRFGGGEGPHYEGAEEVELVYVC